MNLISTMSQSSTLATKRASLDVPRILNFKHRSHCCLTESWSGRGKKKKKNLNSMLRKEGKAFGIAFAAGYLAPYHFSFSLFFLFFSFLFFFFAGLGMKTKLFFVEFILFVCLFFWGFLFFFVCFVFCFLFFYLEKSEKKFLGHFFFFFFEESFLFP